jgi:hypothetical protein
MAGLASRGALHLDIDEHAFLRAAMSQDTLDVMRSVLLRWLRPTSLL